MARTNWKAKYEAAASELAAYKDEVEILERMLANARSRSAPPKSAALVYVDDKPFFTALTHSAAYKLMCAVKAKGHRSVYKPLH